MLLAALRILAAGAVLAGSGAATARAGEVPTYLPNRDVAVTYRIGGKQPGPQDIRVLWSSELGRARIEVGPGFLLADARTRKVVAVMEQAKMALELPTGSADSYLPGPGTRFTRDGSTTVAGHRCTTWEASSDRGSGTACLTDDGVLLRGTGVDRNGRGGSIEATEVDYAAQPDDLFRVPDGFQTLSLPSKLGKLLGENQKR